MGIEDLNITGEEYADTVLLVSHAAEFRSKLAEGLKTQGYRVQMLIPAPTTDQLEEQLAGAELGADLVILDCHDISNCGLETLGIFRQNTSLLGVRYLALVEVSAESLIQQLESLRDVAILQTPFRLSDVIIKSSLELRLRKSGFEHRRGESRIALQNAQLRDLTQRYQAELREATSIQQSLLPKKLPKDAAAVFASAYLPLEAVGGDLYNLWRINEDCVGLFVADVSGHGLSAAFLASMSKLAGNYARKDSPELFLEDMNSGMTPVVPEGRFVTAAAVFFHSKTRTVRVARAGHPPPLLYRAQSNSVEEISPQGLPIGVLQESKYQVLEYQLDVGDRIVLYTDGLSEAQNPEGKMLGTRGIGEILSIQCADRGMSGVIRRIIEGQQQFCAGRLLKDDMTVLGLEIIDQNV